MLLSSKVKGHEDLRWHAAPCKCQRICVMIQWAAVHLPVSIMLIAMQPLVTLPVIQKAPRDHILWLPATLVFMEVLQALFP